MFNKLPNQNTNHVSLSQIVNLEGISRCRDQYENQCMYASMLFIGVKKYTPAGFVNVSIVIGTDLSLISYLTLLPVRMLSCPVFSSNAKRLKILEIMNSKEDLYFCNK